MGVSWHFNVAQPGISLVTSAAGPLFKYCHLCSLEACQVLAHQHVLLLKSGCLLQQIPCAPAPSLPAKRRTAMPLTTELPGLPPVGSVAAHLWATGGL